MKYFKTILFLLIFASPVFSQDFKELEQTLAHLGERSIMAITQEERLESSAEFALILDSTLHLPEASTLQFSTVKNLSVQFSEDGVLNVYTWLVPLKDGTAKHFGILVLNNKEGLEIIYLKDNSLNHEKPEYVWGKPENWYGAIYYDLQTFKYKKDNYYVLFGYRPGNRKTQQKLLEVISVEKNKVKFGAKIFETPKMFDRKYKQRPYRLIFEYNKKVIASMRWHQKEKLIILDHLTAPDISLKGQWEYYGPDFSFDALRWEEGKFHLESNVEVESDVEYVAPQSAPQQGLKKE